MGSGTSESRPLEGRVAVVTGATRGIGLAAAQLLAHAGAKVVISSRKRDACDEVVKTFEREGWTALSAAGHMGRPEDREALIAAVLAAFGGVDILVSNAAVNPVAASASAISPEVWHKTIETNLTAAWDLSRKVIPQMEDRGGGAIVFVSSIAALNGYPKNGAYGVAKAGLIQLGRDLAAAHGRAGVRVNTVVPGATETDMIRSFVRAPEDRKAFEARIPLQRLGTPEDVASAILFLVSDASRQITGQTIVVDGGETTSAAGV